MGEFHNKFNTTRSENTKLKLQLDTWAEVGPEYSVLPVLGNACLVGTVASTEWTRGQAAVFSGPSFGNCMQGGNCD